MCLEFFSLESQYGDKGMMSFVQRVILAYNGQPFKSRELCNIVRGVLEGIKWSLPE